MSTIHEIESPLPGAFYRTPAPNEPPFAEVGQVVEAGATLALVEIMKQFAPIVTEVAGTVVEFCLDHGASVEAGDVLVRIEAA